MRMSPSDRRSSRSRRPLTITLTYQQKIATEGFFIVFRAIHFIKKFNYTVFCFFTLNIRYKHPILATSRRALSFTICHALVLHISKFDFLDRHPSSRSSRSKQQWRLRHLGAKIQCDLSRNRHGIQGGGRGRRQPE